MDPQLYALTTVSECRKIGLRERTKAEGGASPSSPATFEARVHFVQRWRFQAAVRWHRLPGDTRSIQGTTSEETRVEARSAEIRPQAKKRCSVDREKGEVIRVGVLPAERASCSMLTVRRRVG